MFHSFDLTTANIQEVNYLKEVKYNLKNGTLIGDRDYISTDYPADLFTHSNIHLAFQCEKTNRILSGSQK